MNENGKRNEEGRETEKGLNWASNKARYCCSVYSTGWITTGYRETTLEGAILSSHFGACPSGRRERKTLDGMAPTPPISRVWVLIDGSLIDDMPLSVVKEAITIMSGEKWPKCCECLSVKVISVSGRKRAVSLQFTLSLVHEQEREVSSAHADFDDREESGFGQTLEFETLVIASPSHVVSRGSETREGTGDWRDGRYFKL